MVLHSVWQLFQCGPGTESGRPASPRRGAGCVACEVGDMVLASTLTDDSSSSVERLMSHIMPGTTISVGSLRRSSNTGSPTRTLRLTEAEHAASSRNNTPSRLASSAESLASRPRSNPRSRTPMRYESPLNPDEFRMLVADEQSHPSDEVRRITIRPLGGSAVGSVASTRIREERSETGSKSHKQGPSHRKVRRWNNDNFSRLAHEIGSQGSLNAAESLSKGAAEARFYKSIYNPADRTSEAMRRFLQDEKMRDIREKFFDGEVASRQSTKSSKGKKFSKSKEPTVQDQLDRIDPRIRTVVAKSCATSYPAVLVVQRFEAFVVKAFTGESVEETYLGDLLLEPPTITEQKYSARVTGYFYFDPSLSTGGFHRILLVGVCQFHGLKTMTFQSKHESKARGLTVTGRIKNIKYLLQETLKDDSPGVVNVERIGDEMSLLSITSECWKHDAKQATGASNGQPEMESAEEGEESESSEGEEEETEYEEESVQLEPAGRSCGADPPGLRADG